MASGVRRVRHGGAIRKALLRFVRRLPILVAAASIVGGTARATPSVPWMPDAPVRHDIELLADEADLDLVVTQWPLPRAAILHAIDKLPATLTPSLAAARERIRQALREDESSRLTLTVQGRDDALSGFGDDATRGSSLALRSSTLQSDLAAVRVGARFDTISGLQAQPKLRFDDSALVTEALGVQLQAWTHRSWWSPGWQTSLVLSNNAPAMTGIGLQRASASRSDSPWLSWLGPWNYDMFIAQSEDVSQPDSPYFFAQRLTFKPFSNLELALTRTAQWGGKGREGGVHGFLHMLTGQGVNADTVPLEASDPANEMAGFDARLRCPAGLRCATYLQAIGEDQAGVLPSRYLALYGVEAWSGDRRHRYFAEYAQTGCRAPIFHTFLRDCAYRNYAYPQGYTDAGRWMGANVGPDSRVLTLGWVDAVGGTSVRLHGGSVGSRIATFTPDVIDPATTGRIWGLSARQPLSWGAATITPAFDYVHTAAVDGVKTEARIGATLSMGLDGVAARGGAALGASLSGADSAGLRPLWIGAGLVAVATLLDRPVDDYTRAHAQNFAGRSLGHVGSALPFGAFGLAGVSWALQRDTVQGDVAAAALEAGLSAAVVAQVGKYAIDRARPLEDTGPYQRSLSRSDSSFPSIHTAVAWAVVTPYAQFYDAPWFYGLAALTNAGRIAARDHWLSDTVAGAAMGYYLGDLFYRRSGADAASPATRVWFTPTSLHVERRW